MGLALGLKGLRAANQNNTDEAKKTETDKPAPEKTAATDKPAATETKPAVKKPMGMGMGGLGKSLLARLKEAAVNENNESNNVSEINSSKQLLVGVKADDKDSNQADPKDPGPPPEMVRGEGGKKSTFAKLMGKITKKDPAQTEVKRVNSIKQKLLDEETEAAEIDDTFSKEKFKRIKQKIHLILYHPECSNWVIICPIAIHRADHRHCNS